MCVRMNVDLLPSLLRCKSARLPGAEGCIRLMADPDFTCFCRQGSGWIPSRTTPYGTINSPGGEPI